MSHEVFISYSSKDKPIADAICANLEGAGARCWIAPRDIAPGEDWPTAITRAIAASRIMVLIFSASSNSSEDVSREIMLAANCKLVIIPFKIEDIEPEPGKQYYLARTHWLDAINPPSQEQINALVERVKALLPAREPAQDIKVQLTVPPTEERPAGASEPSRPQPRPKKKASRARFLWIPGILFSLLGLIGGWMYLTFITHTLPTPNLAWLITTTATPTATLIPATLTPIQNFTAKVNAVGGARLYEGPGENYPMGGSVIGDVTIIAQAYNCAWYKVVSSSGRTIGWLSADKISYTGQCSDISVFNAMLGVPAKVISISGARLNEGPGDGYPQDGSVIGDVIIIGQAYGCAWYKVISSTGQDVGWVRADKIIYIGQCSDIPSSN